MIYIFFQRLNHKILSSLYFIDIMAASGVEEPLIEKTNSHEFIHDYPHSKFITAVHYSGKKRTKKITHVYEIISLGHYPTHCKKTQKSSLNSIEYDIPDNYIVKVELWKMKITLKTKYYNFKDVKFSLSYNDKTIESKKSGTDLIKIFCKVIQKLYSVFLKKYLLII